MSGTNPLLDGVLRVLRQVANRALDRATRPSRKTRSTPHRNSTRSSGGSRPSHTSSTHAGRPSSYPGDYRSRPRIEYQPHDDNRADPGEIVWTWVPFAEDHSQGKDRPVLLIGRDGDWLLGLQVTSQDHDRDAEQEARAGRHWINIGSGEWDPQRRPSEVRVNRILRIDPTAVRRIGAVLDEATFSEATAEVLRYYR